MELVLKLVIHKHRSLGAIKTNTKFTLCIQCKIPLLLLCFLTNSNTQKSGRGCCALTIIPLQPMVGEQAWWMMFFTSCEAVFRGQRRSKKGPVYFCRTQNALVLLVQLAFCCSQYYIYGLIITVAFSFACHITTAAKSSIKLIWRLTGT